MRFVRCYTPRMQRPLSYARPISLAASTESQVYGLFALAIALTAIGVGLGMQFAQTLLTSGMYILFTVVELGLIFTAGMWSRKAPLNIVLFAVFPTLSGLTITPYLLMLLTGYSNGPAILLNALVATAAMAGAAAIFARTTSWNLGVMGRTLIFALLGLLALMILQFFIPSMQTPAFELMLSGAGVVLFAVFTAYDLQRIEQQARVGANPFLLALNLYLDIFNLFLFILRFMTALSGDRR